MHFGPALGGPAHLVPSSGRRVRSRSSVCVSARSQAPVPAGSESAPAPKARPLSVTIGGPTRRAAAWAAPAATAGSPARRAASRRQPAGPAGRGGAGPAGRAARVPTADRGQAGSGTRPAGGSTVRQKRPRPTPAIFICGNCRIGNDPTRRFCRRCGQSLAEAVVAVAPKVPWYRRIFGRRPRTAAAGERPKSMRTDGRGARRGLSIGRLLTVVIQVVVVAALVGAVVGYARGSRLARRPSTRSSRPSARTVAPNLVLVHTAGQATGPGNQGTPGPVRVRRVQQHVIGPHP